MVQGLGSLTLNLALENAGPSVSVWHQARSVHGKSLPLHLVQGI